MEKLLCRPVPCRYEALQQYILRLARVNGYSISAITTLIRKVGNVPLHSYNKQYRTALSDAVVKLTGHLDVTQLYDPHLLHADHKKTFDFKRVKICSLCLRENGIFNFNWYYRHQLFCDKHQTLLIDHCFSCSTPFTEKIIISMCCETCNIGLMSMRMLPSTIASININKYFCSDQKPLVISRKYELLEPYFELNKKKSYQFWLNNKDISINELYQLLIDILALFYDQKLMEEAIDKLINEAEQKVTLTSATKQVSTYLHNIKYTDFRVSFSRAMLAIHLNYKTLLIPIVWVERIYQSRGIIVEDINKKCFKYNKSEEVIFCLKNTHFLHCRNLAMVLKTCGYKPLLFPTLTNTK